MGTFIFTDIHSVGSIEHCQMGRFIDRIDNTLQNLPGCCKKVIVVNIPGAQLKQTHIDGVKTVFILFHIIHVHKCIQKDMGAAFGNVHIVAYLCQTDPVVPGYIVQNL